MAGRVFVATRALCAADLFVTSHNNATTKRFPTPLCGGFFLAWWLHVCTFFIFLFFYVVREFLEKRVPPTNLSNPQLVPLN